MAQHDARRARALPGAHEGARRRAADAAASVAAGGGQAGGREVEGSGRGGRSATQARRQRPGRRRDLGRGIAGNVTAGTAITSGATTIDSLFGPLQIDRDAAAAPGCTWTSS